MSQQIDCDSTKVLLEGPPTVYIVKQPDKLFSTGVTTSKCAIKQPI
jgi:hypothetical protein